MQIAVTSLLQRSDLLAKCDSIYQQGSADTSNHVPYELLLYSLNNPLTPEQGSALYDRVATPVGRSRIVGSISRHQYQSHYS